MKGVLAIYIYTKGDPPTLEVQAVREGRAYDLGRADAALFVAPSADDKGLAFMLEIIAGNVRSDGVSSLFCEDASTLEPPDELSFPFPE